MTSNEATQELVAMLIDARARAAGYELLGHGYKQQQAEVDVEALTFAIAAIEKAAKLAA